VRGFEGKRVMGPNRPECYATQWKTRVGGGGKKGKKRGVHTRILQRRWVTQRKTLISEKKKDRLFNGKDRK